jgi:hypothetical protein
MEMNNQQAQLVTYDRIVGEARATVCARAARGSSWADRVYLGLEALLIWIAERPADARIVLIEARFGGSATTSRHEATFAELERLLRIGREDTQAAKAAPEILERALVAGMASFLSSRLANGKVASIPQLCPELATLLLLQYLGKQGAKRVVTSHLGA